MPDSSVDQFVSIVITDAGEHWDVDLVADELHRARGATILRTVALALYDANLICPAHYKAIMESECGA